MVQVQKKGLSTLTHHSNKIVQPARKNLQRGILPRKPVLFDSSVEEVYTPFSSFSLVAMKSPLFAIILLLLSALALFWTFFPPPLP